MPKLTLKINNWSYEKDIYLPTDTIQKPPPIFKPEPKIVSEYKSVKILPEGTPSFPNANEGETIKITATVTCNKENIVSKPRDTAYLIIDTEKVDEKKVENGTVTFEWKATSTPFNIHTICIKVPPSELCKGSGQDCKKITVSPTQLSPAEQLAKERQSATEQRRLLEESRQKLREDIISGNIPTIEKPPTTVPQFKIETPTTTAPTVPTTEPPTTAVPDTGSIELIGLPIEIVPAIPIYFYVDGENKGRIYEKPKTFINIPTGIRTVYIQAGDFKSLPKTVVVTKNQTSSIIL